MPKIDFQNILKLTWIVVTFKMFIFGKNKTLVSSSSYSKSITSWILFVGRQKLVANWLWTNDANGSACISH